MWPPFLAAWQEAQERLDRVVVAKHSAIYRLAAIDLQNPMTHSLFSVLPTYVSVYADVSAVRVNKHTCGHWVVDVITH